jgi:ABC-type branched-subunit amino acid transport system ATPase component
MASIRTADLTKNFGDLRAVNEIDLDLRVSKSVFAL